MPVTILFGSARCHRSSTYSSQCHTPPSDLGKRQVSRFAQFTHRPLGICAPLSWRPGPFLPARALSSSSLRDAEGWGTGFFSMTGKVSLAVPYQTKPPARTAWSCHRKRFSLSADGKPPIADSEKSEGRRTINSRAVEGPEQKSSQQGMRPGRAERISPSPTAR